MEPITYIDRTSGAKCIERVYGQKALKLLYGNDWVTKLIGVPLLKRLVRYPFFSSFYGQWQNLAFTKKKVLPFIKKFNVDVSEFLEPAQSYPSFNDFFIRKLKPESRPITPSANSAIIPADGRYLFFPNIDESTGFLVKGEKFDLEKLLEDKILAHNYSHGTMVIARLCPTDYHRYHFPCDCLPSETRYINGWLYSVNPIALKKDIEIFTKNKRTICSLQTTNFGKILFLEVGATNVGSIHQTYTPDHPQHKGAEKGFFSFGGSSLVLLFEPGRIILDSDLIEASAQHLEIKCLMGQQMGLACSGATHK